MVSQALLPPANLFGPGHHYRFERGRILNTIAGEVMKLIVLTPRSRAAIG
jgi:hypothetical protein